MFEKDGNCIMKNLLAFGLVALMIFIITTGCGGSENKVVIPNGEEIQDDEISNIPNTPELPPQLDVVLFNTGIADNDAQSVRAIQLGMSWMFYDENGIGRGIEADSPHPLQMRRDAYIDATLLLNNAICDCVDWREHLAVKLIFNDDYPPDSVSVIRWDASLLTGNQDIDDIINKGEAVNIDGNIIPILVDGNDYVYSIFAVWQEGRSDYAFITEFQP